MMVDKKTTGVIYDALYNSDEVKGKSDSEFRINIYVNVVEIN